MSDATAVLEPVCWFQLACLRKMPPGWRWYRSKTITNGFLMTGSIPVGVYKSGARKGRTKWDSKNDSQVVVTREEIHAEMMRWEAETGKCSDCLGRGQELRGWSKAEGQIFRPCKRCNATGNAKLEANE